MGLLVASRKSDLARLQSYQVGDALLAADPSLEINYHFRQSLGDINQKDPLWKMPEKGVFTQDFREGLLKGEFDMVVHSWKDLPIDQEEGTELVATLPRADMRDMLLLKKNNLDHIKESKKLRLYSSSPRRMYNLTRFFKKCFPGQPEDIHFESVRGNILTRVKKLIEDPKIDGLIVAKAAIDRLLTVTREEFIPGQKELSEYLQHCYWQVLPLSENPTAAAQGAIVIEINSSRKDLKDLLSKIHCQKTWESVVKERQVLKSHGGGCHQKIGVSNLNREFGELQYLRGETEAGETLHSDFAQELLLNIKNPLSKKVSFFKRKQLEPVVPSGVNAHYVARHNALPESQLMSPDEVLWTSGLKTWEKLAQRGYWVHGSSESLGEKEDPRIEVLAGPRQWAKWTHDSGPEASTMPNIVSYHLVPEDVHEDLSSYQSFYWMSGTQFLRAIEIEPLVLEGDHYSGPGHTAETINRVLKEHNKKSVVKVLPNYDVWKKAIEV